MLSEGIQAAAWSPDDKRLAAVAADASVQLWDTASSRPIRTLEGKLDPPYDVRMAWSPDGTWLAVAAVQRLLLCSTETGKVLWQNADQVAIDQLAWSPDGRRLATTDRGDKGTVRVWDADTGKRLHEFPLRSRGLAWSPDGKTLAAGPDGQEDALLIDADSGTVRLRLHPVVRVTAIRWSSDGKEVILLDEENGRSNRSVWDAATGKRLHGQTVSDHWLGAPVWSPNGRMVAFWDPSEITLTDADGQRLGVLLPFDLFGQLAVTADGHFRGSARLERLVRVVVQKRDGSSETLTPAEFEQKYGAKNDPAQVRLVE
jgi:WD40 repeat protein